MCLSCACPHGQSAVCNAAPLQPCPGTRPPPPLAPTNRASTTLQKEACMHAHKRMHAPRTQLCVSSRQAGRPNIHLARSAGSSGISAGSSSIPRKYRLNFMSAKSSLHSSLHPGGAWQGLGCGARAADGSRCAHGRARATPCSCGAGSQEKWGRLCVHATQTSTTRGRVGASRGAEGAWPGAALRSAHVMPMTRV